MNFLQRGVDQLMGSMAIQTEMTENPDRAAISL